ncbi:hemerythrin domain-containing protein [Gordonia liuliyuniae]|uniref:Hemerythrin domain-containing protein n=1 Tax=Gordonia liuliyuniae TaxID=2911517 RepID=A0ABS9IQH8_9ACTN|nr:hemerythrin domain-containing protein [Gordonia liuliyuniae]MCF8587801.1 hemerythrin domain-containing protein [Gordonia liuliyuniae]
MSDLEERDVVDILTDDHEKMVALAERVHSTSDPEMRRNIADTVTAEVVRHAVAEEMYVYPAIIDLVPDGRDEVDHDEAEHQQLMETMKKLEGLDADDPAFSSTFDDLIDQLRHHASDEENDQFPKLRRVLNDEDLVEMGRKVEAAKLVAPTRPHPDAPHSELFHKTVGPGVGLVDRLRDVLAGRMTKEDHIE